MRKFKPKYTYYRILDGYNKVVYGSDCQRKVTKQVKGSTRRIYVEGFDFIDAIDCRLVHYTGKPLKA